MTPTNYPDHYRSLKTLSIVTIAGLAFIGVFELIAIVLGLGQIISPDMSFDVDEDGPISAWLMLQGLILLAQVPFYIGTIVLFLVWLNRAHKNLLALRPSHLEFSSGWAVGWWFVPFANLVKPFQVVREVWWESDPQIHDGEMFLTASLHSAPAYMGFWWAFWILSNIVANILSRIYDPGRMETVFIVGFVFILSGVLTAIAAGLAITVVRDITVRQEKRHGAVVSMQRNPFAYSEPDTLRPGTMPWQI